MASKDRPQPFYSRRSTKKVSPPALRRPTRKTFLPTPNRPLASKRQQRDRKLSTLRRRYRGGSLPLFEQFPQLQEPAWPSWRSSWDSYVDPLEILEDEAAPPVLPEEKIRGGTRIFKLQALCPFKAFVEIRCGATHKEPIALAVQPLERGLLVHRVLHYLWEDIQTQERLLELEKPFLQQKIRGWIDKAFEETVASRPNASALLALEKERCLSLIEALLDLERARPPFRVVATERTVLFHLGEHTLRFSIDRIDELTNGQRLLIDYKTRTTQLSDWFGDRPSEPQLLLYALAEPENLAGLAYLECRRQDPAWNGMIEDRSVFPSLQGFPKQTPHLSDWQENWRKILENLWQNFLRGDARIDPKSKEICEHCHLQGVCRIREHT